MEKIKYLPAETAKADTSKLDLIEKIWNKVQSEDKEDKILSSLMGMAHNVLNASAASLLLLDKKNQELYFKFASGPVADQLKRLHIGRKSGVAGWIVRNVKPVVINNPERNANFYRLIDNATGFRTRAMVGVPLIVKGKVVGVIEVLNKADDTPFTKHDMNILMGVAITTGMAVESVRQAAFLLYSFKRTVRALVALADAKETSGGGHSRRVAEYVLMAATEMKLSEKKRDDIEYAAILHDIGKLSIPDAILNKTDALTEEEWKIMKKHPVVGYNMLKDIPFLKDASKLILAHHERYDGGGYPHGLHGKAIPLGARLLAVADAFDHMTMEHTYRKALTQKEAFEELIKNMHSQFCPASVKAFNAGFVKTRLKKSAGL